MSNIPDTLIVTATLGDRSSIDKTIESVKRFGGKRVKHVLISPAKNFDTLNANYPDLTILIEPSDCTGLYGALNYAFHLLGKNFTYWGFINDDDFWLPGYSKLFEVLDSSPELDAVYGRVHYTDINSNFIGEQTCSSQFLEFGALLKSNIILFTQQAVLARIRLFNNLGGFDENYRLVADTKFWLMALKSGSKFKYINEICAGYSIHENQLSANKLLQRSEHLHLLKTEVPADSSINIWFQKWYFRIVNLPVYCKRMLTLKLKIT